MSWHETPLTRLLGVRLPIVQAAMAGGPSTPRLAAAVSEAGGLGSVAGAALSPDELRTAIRETRALTDKPFAVNLFAPLPPPSGERVAEWAALVEREPALPPLPAWSAEDQLAVLAAEEVRIHLRHPAARPLRGVNDGDGDDGRGVDRTRSAATPLRSPHSPQIRTGDGRLRVGERRLLGSSIRR